MSSETLHQEIINFFENIEKYYGSKTEITEGLCIAISNFNPKNATWNLSEFQLIRSAYRNNGDRLMMEGEKMYYEISANQIIHFKQEGRNKFEFIEQYGETVFRITKIRFHYKY